MNHPLTLMRSDELYRIQTPYGRDGLLAHQLLAKYHELLVAADSDPFFYGVALDKEKERIVVCNDEDVVGFFEFGRTEYQGKNYFRANRPYVAPAYRGQGLMRNALQMWFRIRRPAMAWIDDDNISSIRLYQGLGFVNNHPLNHKQKDGHVYFLK